MIERLNRAWRFAMTATSFACFGAGGLVLGLMVFPVVHLFGGNRRRAQRICRMTIHYSFRAYLRFMRGAGVLDLHTAGRSLRDTRGIIVANHPSLIDVILIVAAIPDLYCVVKGAVWRNPFMAIVVRGAGYIPSDDIDRLVRESERVLSEGASLLLFPEGTRSVPGEAMRFRHGVSVLIHKSECPVVPVRIDVTPRTLTKGEPWYAIPRRRPEFTLRAGEPVAARQLVHPEYSERQSIRQCTVALQDMVAAL